MVRSAVRQPAQHYFQQTYPLKGLLASQLIWKICNTSICSVVEEQSLIFEVQIAISISPAPSINNRFPNVLGVQTINQSILHPKKTNACFAVFDVAIPNGDTVIGRHLLVKLPNRTSHFSIESSDHFFYARINKCDRARFKRIYPTENSSLQQLNPDLGFNKMVPLTVLPCWRSLTSDSRISSH